MILNPKVSIIIPVYNGSNYLKEAIDSALSQTYANTEVIVINDGSTDSGATERIAKSYENRIRYYSKENGGVSSALNSGIEKMEGQYFAWLSHDDTFAKNRIEEDINLIRSNSEISVTFCNTKEIDDTGLVLSETTIEIETINNPMEYLRVGTINMCSLTINKNCFLKTGFFSLNNKTMQDVEMGLNLSRHFKFYFNPNTCTYKRIHSEMGTITLNNQHDKDALALFNKIGDRFSLKDYFPDLNIDSGKEVYMAYLELGELYKDWSSFNHADKFYISAYKINGKIISLAFLVKLVGTGFLFSTLPRSSAGNVFRKMLLRIFR